MFRSIFCCSKTKSLNERKQFCLLISNCVKQIETLLNKRYNIETDTIKQLPEGIQDTIKEIYKKTKDRINPEIPIIILLNDLLANPLTHSLNELENLMDKKEFNKFANTVVAPFEKSDNVCRIM